MKKPSKRSQDDLRPEYDFASMQGGIRGKYAARLQAATNVVVLEDDVAAAFPSDDAVNEALRVVLKAAASVSRKKGVPNQPLQRTGFARR